ncbi:MAG: NAD-dependent epimerase/dehydratase family protein [Deltaproteobacteria bacterium]|nr:NAD-dependent epimerase/dehydratase family protein [Deltaproteobacteria bacterium]
MRILVTGGAGFIGSHLVDRFVADGNDVVVLDDLSSGVREHVNPAARLVVADVRGPVAAAAVTAFAPEVLCLHAAQMDVRKSVAVPAFDADVNLVGLLNVMESARAAGGLQHVLFASSGGAMYGEQDEFPARENHAVRPESPYGLAKAVSEQYLDWYLRFYKIPYTALRYGNVYGPRQNPHGEAGVVAIFCARILTGKSITIFGDGTQTRDYVFVEDVVNANALALQKRLVGGFNVGQGKETNVNQLATALLAASPTKVEVIHAAGRPGEQKRSVIDPAKLHAACGWKAATAVDDGLARTFKWFAERAARAT